MKSTKRNVKNQNGITRKEALKSLGGVALVPWLLAAGSSGTKDSGRNPYTVNPGEMVWPFELPELPYPADALEPVIDRQTMEIHHGRHHRGYTDNLNRVLEDFPALRTIPLEELLADLQNLPGEVREAVRNNGGGYYNHCLFWPLLQKPLANQKPSGPLAEVIVRDFGSLEGFKEQFNGAAGSLFGSGWAWLALEPEGGLQIVQLSNQDTVLMEGLHPVLGIDVWEHAYYLNYQNRRSEYINRFWEILNWEQAQVNYNAGI